jgi:hypothetical protein
VGFVERGAGWFVVEQASAGRVLPCFSDRWAGLIHKFCGKDGIAAGLNISRFNHGQQFTHPHGTRRR